MKNSARMSAFADEDEGPSLTGLLSLAFVGQRLKEALPHLGLRTEQSVKAADAASLSLEGINVFLQVLPQDVHLSPTTVALVAVIPMMNANDPECALRALRSNIYMQLMHGCSTGADVNGEMFLMSPVDLALIDDVALAAMLKRMSRLARSLCDDSRRQFHEAGE